MSFEDFWLLRDKLVPMNDTVEEVTLQLAVKPLALWWWQIQQQMEQSFQMQMNMGIAQDGESDEVRGWVAFWGACIAASVAVPCVMLHSAAAPPASVRPSGPW